MDNKNKHYFLTSNTIIMIKIKIVRDTNIINFSKEIEKLLLKNWKLRGGFKIDNENFLHQMLIKKSTKKIEKP